MEADYGWSDEDWDTPGSPDEAAWGEVVQQADDYDIVMEEAEQSLKLREEAKSSEISQDTLTLSDRISFFQGAQTMEDVLTAYLLLEANLMSLRCKSNWDAETWLATLGADYAIHIAAFRHNGVDVAVLQRLIKDRAQLEEALIEIGIQNRVHRENLIAKLMDKPWARGFAWEPRALKIAELMDQYCGPFVEYEFGAEFLKCHHCLEYEIAACIKRSLFLFTNKARELCFYCWDNALIIRCLHCKYFHPPSTINEFTQICDRCEEADRNRKVLQVQQTLFVTGFENVGVELMSDMDQRQDMALWFLNASDPFDIMFSGLSLMFDADRNNLNEVCHLITHYISHFELCPICHETKLYQVDLGGCLCKTLTSCKFCKLERFQRDALGNSVCHEHAEYCFCGFPNFAGFHPFCKMVELEEYFYRQPGSLQTLRPNLVCNYARSNIVMAQKISAARAYKDLIMAGIEGNHVSSAMNDGMQTYI